MTLDNLATFLRRELTKDIAKMLSQLAIDYLASVFWNEDNGEFAVPNRVI